MTRATKPGESSRQDIFTNWTAAVGGQQTRRRSRRVSRVCLRQRRQHGASTQRRSHHLLHKDNRNLVG